MNRRFSVLLCAATFCAGLGHVALAQTAPQSVLVPQTPTGERKTRHFIRLRNVPPSMMAWWLDPQHNEEPVQMRQSRDIRQANPLITDKSNPKKEVPPLPAGIGQIIAIDPQSALSVSSTEAGFSELQKLVALLDQPIRQVEVTGEFVQISPEDAKKLGISISSDPKKRYSAVPLSAGTLARIAELKAQNKVKVLIAPRVSALNNLTAESSSQISRPFFIDIAARLEPRSAAVKLTGTDPLMMLVSTKPTFTVTPTIGSDDSLQLQLAPARILQLEPARFSSRRWIEEITPAQFREMAQNNPQPIPLRVLEGAITTVNAKDGETFALTGFDSHFFAAFEGD